jgi:hypothetical protein
MAVAGGGGGFPGANSIKVDASGQSQHTGDCAMDVLLSVILHAKSVKAEGVFSSLRSPALLQKFAMFGGASVLRTLVAQSYQRSSPNYLGHVHQPWLHDFFVGMFAGVCLPEDLLGEDSEGNPTVNLAHALVMEHFGHMEAGDSNVAYGIRYFFSRFAQVFLFFQTC